MLTSKERVELLNTGKINCWDFVKCGRELGGENVAEMGICPASIDISANGLNDGKNGGRICWAIAGTFCEKKIQGLFAKRLLSCKSCNFFKTVKREEGIKHFRLTISNYAPASKSDSYNS